MTLKYEIDSTEGLDEAIVALYQKDEATGKFRLKVEGAPDVSGLRAKVDELLDEKKKEQQKARSEAEKRAKAEGDIATLETSWQQKLDELQANRDGEIANLTKVVSHLTVGRAAAELAGELAVEGAAMALLPHIERRLRMEIVNGEPKVRVLDAEGKISALSLDQLKEQIRADANLSRIVSGSKASGGGADGGKENGGGATKPLSEMGDAERTEWAQRDPAGFEKAVAAEKAKLKK